MDAHGMIMNRGFFCRAWQAGCICGWEGPEDRTESQAENDFMCHCAEASRQLSKRTNAPSGAEGKNERGSRRWQGMAR